MGYGFCLPDNPADRITLGFSTAMLSYIETIKATRSISIVDLGTSHDDPPSSASHREQENPTRPSVHWVRLSGDETCIPPYEFSPSFLEDFSIGVENRRERSKPRTTLEITFFDNRFSRIKLHVLCAVIMILQRNQRAIRNYDKYLPSQPQTKKQANAALYRYGQLRVLDRTLDSLYRTLRKVIGLNPDDVRNPKVFRLEHILTDSPKTLLKDFRSVLNAGLQTRDPKKIRKRGGGEFAFAIWVCGLWLLSQDGEKHQEEKKISEQISLDEHFSQWICFLQDRYSFPTTDHKADPIEGLPFSHSMLSNNDVEGNTAEIATSYLDAIHVAVGKHPRILYNDPRVTIQRLEWFLHIVRQEGVWCPGLEEGAGEDDDEWVLFLETGDA